MENLMYLTSVAYGIFALILLYRLVKGPTPADRVIAADAIDTITCAILVFYSVYTGRSIYLDIAIVSALLGFIGTLFIARFLEGRL